MVKQTGTRFRQQNLRLPIIGSFTNRDSSGNKDQRFVNVFPETRKVEAIESTRIFLNKRPGLSLFRAATAGEGRGISYFNSKFYYAIGNKVYEDAASPVEKITLTGSTGPVGMTLGNSSTLGDYLFICDGTSAWVIKSDGTVLTISNDGLRTISVVTSGGGYATAPKVYLSGGGGTGATATATITGGAVDMITVTDSGTGYTSAPTVVFGFPVTFTNGTERVNATAHGMEDTERVSFSTTGTLPTGLNSTTAYFVVNKTTDDFQVSLTSGGAAVAFSTNGTGTITANTGGPTVSAATATALLNAFPTPHIPTPTFIDGYIILPQRSDVYNCMLDEPTQWDAGQYLSAEMFPDSIVSLSRQNNQVVVFGETSTEFFYDAANVNGSPLSRNDSTTIQAGCAFPYAVFQNEKTCIFVGQSDSGGRAVWQVEGFQPRKISDEFIERILDKETSPTTCRGYGIRTMGHLFYVLQLPTLGRTFLYDIEEKLWHEWSGNSTGTHVQFPYNHMADNKSGSAYLLHSSNGNIVKLDTTAYQDISTAILVDLTTNKYDMDTYRRKFMSGFRLVGDRHSTGNSVDVRWTDDDYQTWSGTKTIALTDDWPNFARLGSFRRRAFNIKHALNYPLRLESIEVDYYEGEN